MIENHTYTCEICNHTWGIKDLAEKCEAIGYPENYNKLLGKWIIVPTSVYFSTQKSESDFSYHPSILWRVVRIDSNYISNLSTAGLPVVSGINNKNEFEKKYGEDILKTHHRLVVKCKGFEDNSIVESLKETIYVDDNIFEDLNSCLVEVELKRNALKTSAKEQNPVISSVFFSSIEFEKYQHEMAEKMLKLAVDLMKIELPKIDKSTSICSISFENIQ